MQTSSKKTLYDILEVSSQASDATIRAAFDHLTQRHQQGQAIVDPALDPAVAYNLVKDAFFTLGNAGKRAAYDASLIARQTPADLVVVEQASSFGWMWKAALAVVAASAVGYYFNYKNDLEVKKQELIAQQKQAEAQALAKQHEIEALRAEERVQREAQQAELQRARDLRETRADADRNARALAYAEESARREEERRKREEESERRRQESRDTYAQQAERREAERRAAQDRQRLQQLDYERRGRPGGGAIGGN